MREDQPEHPSEPLPRYPVYGRPDHPSAPLPRYRGYRRPEYLEPEHPSAPLPRYAPPEPPSEPPPRYRGYRRPEYLEPEHPSAPLPRYPAYGRPDYPSAPFPQYLVPEYQAPPVRERPGHGRPRSPSAPIPQLPAPDQPRQLPGPGQPEYRRQLTAGAPPAPGSRVAARRRRSRSAATLPARPAPRAHWLLVMVFCAAIGMCLLVNGYTHGLLGQAPGTVGGNSAGLPPAPASVRNAAGPIVEAWTNPPRTAVMPPRTIALTFNDGPDPRWTPKILAVLRRFGVHATFFETGARAAAHPALTRAVLEDGNEIGTDTYSHADLGTVGWRRGIELTLAQNALAGSAGVHTRLLRLPYWPSLRTLNGAEWQAVREAGKDGYLVVFAGHDTLDWSGRTVSTLVGRAMPRGHQGEVVTMEDGGAHATKTVAALSKLLTRLRGKGYRFTTITSGLGVPSADIAATKSQRLAGDALVAAQRISSDVVSVLTLVLLLTAGLAALRLAILVLYAYVHRRRMRRLKFGKSRRPQFPAFTGPISVIVPAYNEATGIAGTVLSLCEAHYLSEVEIIVVDDGSTDRTAHIAHRLAIPGVRVVSQPNTGKSAALNTGVALASHDIVVLVDGDTAFEKFALARLVAPFSDPAVAAVSGNTKVGNRRGLLGRWQHIEYVIGFNLDRRMFDVIGCMPTVPGAIGAFRREVLQAVGGVSDDTLAEDTDLSMTICRAGYRVAYVEDARAWTEAPSSWRQLWRQRYRWCYGTLQAMWKHKRAFIDSGPSGRFGRRCLAYLMVFQVVLPLLAPIIDISAVYAMLVLNPARAIGVWLAFNALQLIAAVYAFRLDRERLRPLWALPLQQVAYRQLLYLVSIQSVTTALLGVGLRWRPMRRAGSFASAPAPGRAP